jgi:predicted small secreted protein
MARPLHIASAADRHDASYRVTINSTKGDIMKRLFALALAATFALPSFALLSGCNTVEGAGKDIQKGGEKIKEEAKENKKY